ncbi:conserved exported hypothetical protein [Cupriavidus necator]|uniref:DUF1254 domain-containing protein n=1 Tax=Cupriavidus necator TaxID=106590 RepID=A0A1K0J9W7_CUPNE|nr:conserved exported hypothetical protein [Cupriavidus necator]
MSISNRAVGASMLAVSVLAGLAGCSNPPAAALAAASAVESRPAPAAVSEQDINDAYVYLLGRLLVLRQQQIDFQKEGFQWNRIIHRDVGGVSWANPNLDVAYSEAWVAVDEKTCTVFSVPAIKGRYYTIQFLNGWGETVANINERNYPDHPSGEFAMCLKGATAALSPNARRIDLPGKTSRVLARVEIGADKKQAIALQHQITTRITGTPTIAPVPATPAFSNDKLPGVEAFDSAAVALRSEPDINPGMEPIQAKVRAVSAAVASSPAERARVDKVIREKTLPAFFQSFSTAGTIRNGWNRPATIGKYGSDYQTRTRIDLGGIWANSTDEVVYFKTDTDGTGTKLDGGNVYTITFPKDQLPVRHVKYFWSVIAVDSRNFRVIPNAKNRFLINKQSRLSYGKDGSLTLYFAPARPKDAPDGNWLPTPKGQNYHLTFRLYGPDQPVLSGEWFPAPLIKRN